MSENTSSNSLINIELPPSIDNAVTNLTDKPTASMGTTLSDLWYLVFGGISYQAEKKKIKYSHDLEEYRKELAESIAQISEEKRIEPSVQTTAQALENSKYCLEEKELRLMFTSLISNSMNADFQKDIHPSFAEILKQMSPLDATIIKTFKNSSTSGFPLCRYQKVQNKGHITLLENVFLNYQTSNLAESSLAISSLVRLGLLETTYEESFTNDSLYTPFTEHPWFHMLKKQFPNATITIKRGRAFLSPLGRSFVRVCIPD